MHWYGNPNKYATCPGVYPNILGNTGHRDSNWPVTRYFVCGNRHRISETVLMHDSDFWPGCNHRYGSRHRYWVCLHNSLCGNRHRFLRCGLPPVRSTNYDWGIARAPIPGWWYGMWHTLSKYQWLYGWDLLSGCNYSDDSLHRYWVCWYTHWHDKPNRLR